jgi:hypothetical protein
MSGDGISPNWETVAHPGLAGRVPAIANQASSDATRELALSIGERRHVVEVAGSGRARPRPNGLVQLEDRRRIRGVFWAAPQASELIKPLAFWQPPTIQDELRGLALRACWPEHTTAAELFRVRRPQRSNFSGSYSSFLHDLDIAAQLTVADLPTALTWVAQQDLDHEYWQPLTRIAGTIVTRAWREDNDDVLKQLTPIVYRAYHDFWCPFFLSPGGDRFETSNDTAAVNAMLEADTNTRHRCIDNIVRAMPEDTPFHLLAHSECPLVRQSDFGWLLDQACEATGLRAVDWAKLARRVMNWVSSEHSDLWLRAVERCPVVAAVLNYPRVIQIDSAEGRGLKAEYLREQRNERRTVRRQMPAAGRGSLILPLCTLTDRARALSSLTFGCIEMSRRLAQ